MYPGSTEPWGKQYGGVANKADCQGLPPFPQQQGPMKSANDSLVWFCERGFDKGVRQEGGGNPSIQTVARVKCPSELTEFTQFKRTDDPADGVLLDSGVADHECQAGQPGGTLAWCLTRMMDCRKYRALRCAAVRSSAVRCAVRCDTVLCCSVLFCAVLCCAVLCDALKCSDCSTA